jgi:hypothetical protein
MGAKIGGLDAEREGEETPFDYLPRADSCEISAVVK